MNKHLRVVIPGGSGQVGTVLSRHFHAQGHEVVVLARKSVPAPWRVVSWDGENLGQWTSELEDSNVVINLAGTFWKVLSSAWLYQDNASLVDEL